MSKVNAYVEISGYFLMVSELATVVQGQCVNTRLMGRETVSYTVMNRISRFVWGMREKGISGEVLDPAESRQFLHLTKMYLTQAFHMLRLYDQGLISEAEVRGAFRSTRLYAQQGQFREEIEADLQDERRRGLILDDDGLDKWLNVGN